MLKKWLIRLSVLLNLLVVIAVVGLWWNIGALLLGFLEGNHERRVSFFDSYPVQAGDIVFLGDSITDGGEWSEIFPDQPTRNRGIGGDITTGVLARLHQVTAGKPAAVFLKIGTNDLTHGPRERRDSYRQYREILQRIQSESPHTVIYVQSLLPRATEYREEVERYNQEIQKLAGELQITYIDLYPHFLAEDGSIKDDFSNDELHLNGAGYQLWQRLISAHVLQAAHAGASP